MQTLIQKKNLHFAPEIRVCALPWTAEPWDCWDHLVPALSCHYCCRLSPNEVRCELPDWPVVRKWGGRRTVKGLAGENRVLCLISNCQIICSSNIERAKTDVKYWLEAKHKDGRRARGGRWRKQSINAWTERWFGVLTLPQRFSFSLLSTKTLLELQRREDKASFLWWFGWIDR